MEEYDNSFAEFDRSVLTALMGVVSPSPQKATYELLQRFPSFQQATRADYRELAAVVGDKGAKLLRTIPDAVSSMTRETAKKAASYILAIEAAKLHFSALLNGRRNEVLAVVYMDIKNRLIGEDLWEGTIDRLSIYPREIMRRTVLLDASTVLIAHNHPSGDTTPSREDVMATHRLELALETIDVVLLDHIIFGEGEPYSLRANGEI